MFLSYTKINIRVVWKNDVLNFKNIIHIHGGGGAYNPDSRIHRSVSPTTRGRVWPVIMPRRYTKNFPGLEFLRECFSCEFNYPKERKIAKSSNITFREISEIKFPLNLHQNALLAFQDGHLTWDKINL